MDNRTNDDILSELNRDKITEYAAAIGYAAVVMVFGIIGNVASVVFYGYKSIRTTTNKLIMYLAATDMVACFANTGLIIQLIFSIDFTNRLGCKVMFFISHCLVVISSLILVVIGVGRFRKICRPHQWQLTFKKAKLCVGGIIVFGLLTTSRDFVFLDIVPFNVTVPETGQQIQARHCSHTNDHKIEMAVLMGTFFDLLLVIAIVVCLGILYTNIVLRLWKHQKALNQKMTDSRPMRTNNFAIAMTSHVGTSLEKKANASQTINELNPSAYKATNATSDQIHVSSTDEAEIIEYNDDTREKTSSCNYNSLNTTTEMIDFLSSTTEAPIPTIMQEKQRNSHACEGKSYKTNYPRNDRKLSGKCVERNITSMMIAITAASLLSFVPHLIVSLTKDRESHFPELDVGTQIVFRSYILNSAINPYITLIFNPEFRSFVARNIFEIFCCSI